jgi:hypothetical protein
MVMMSVRMHTSVGPRIVASVRFTSFRRVCERGCSGWRARNVSGATVHVFDRQLRQVANEVGRGLRSSDQRITSKRNKPAIIGGVTVLAVPSSGDSRSTVLALLPASDGTRWASTATCGSVGAATTMHRRIDSERLRRSRRLDHDEGDQQKRKHPTDHCDHFA